MRTTRELLDEIESLRGENEQLRDALGITTEIPLCLGLTPYQKRLLGFLLKRDRVPRENMHLAIMRTVGSKRDETDPKMVDATICKMRKKLRPRGIEISTDWGFGYFMAADSKARLRQIIAAELPA
jgi:two-component system, cell cycle response regulator CtrA